MAARPYFDEELSRLKQGMIEMGELVKEAIDGSFEAVRLNNKTKAYLVSENDVLINKKEREIESLCISLLLREQPVATDLRQITAALKMITDLEHIGDHVVNIAEWVEYAITGIRKGNKVGVEQPEEGYDRE